MYCGDFYDEFPPRGLVNTQGSWVNCGEYGWVGNAGTYGGYPYMDATSRLLNPYLGKWSHSNVVAVARCPCDTNTVNDNYYQFGNSYGANCDVNYTWTLDLHPAASSLRSWKTTQIKSTSRMVVFGETGCYLTSWNPVAIPAVDFKHTTIGDTRWNVSFADGHAAFTKFLYTLGVNNWFGPTYTFNRDLQQGSRPRRVQDRFLLEPDGTLTA